MKIKELRDKKIAEIWVVEQTNPSCYDNVVVIKDNYEDAKAYYDKICHELRTCSELQGLSFTGDSSSLKIRNEEKKQTVWLVSIHTQRFEITDKAN